MVVSVSGAQPSGASIQVQAGSHRPGIGRPAVGLAFACSVVWLAGCSQPPSLNPVDWWHAMQGGRIAEDRPNPPGADDPYPNLSTVPPRPAPPDRDAMKNLTAALVGDRTNARYAAEAAPLTDPSSPSASPNLFGSGTLPPPPPASASGAAPAISASLPAASAPPKPPEPAAPPSRAPVASVQSAPLDAPAPAAAPAVPPPSMPSVSPPPSAPAPVTAQPPAQAAPGSTAELAPPPISPGTLPPLPTEPPARAAVAPSPPPPPPQAISPIPAPASAAATVIPFAAASSAISPTAGDEIKAFAARRGGGSIVVTGYGDAVSSDPGSQTVALSLALTRAQAVANALAAAGVPQTVIRVGAEAGGRGVGLRLLQ